LGQCEDDVLALSAYCNAWQRQCFLSVPIDDECIGGIEVRGGEIAAAGTLRGQLQGAFAQRWQRLSQHRNPVAQTSASATRPSRMLESAGLSCDNLICLAQLLRGFCKCRCDARANLGLEIGQKFAQPDASEGRVSIVRVAPKLKALIAAAGLK
jgi:hypothetical protein